MKFDSGTFTKEASLHFGQFHFKLALLDFPSVLTDVLSLCSEVLEEALVGSDPEGPLCELLFFFLSAIFQALAEEQEEVAKDQAEGAHTHARTRAHTHTHTHTV